MPALPVLFDGIVFSLCCPRIWTEFFQVWEQQPAHWTLEDLGFEGLGLGGWLISIISSSLTSAVMAGVLKEAVIEHLLKKPSLDHEELSNYLPVSNLPWGGGVGWEDACVFSTSGISG